MDNSSSYNETTLDLEAYSSVAGTILILLSIVFLILTITSYAAIRNLCSSIAGKMVFNITAAILAHQLLILAELIRQIISHNTVLHIERPVALYFTLLAYFGTVLMLLFAAEAVNLFTRIVLVFPEIDHYVIKATLTAWISPLILYGLFYSVLHLWMSPDPRHLFLPLHSAIIIISTLYLPMLLLQLFLWTAFFTITYHMCCRCCQHKGSTTVLEFKEKLRILILLNIFLGLPLLFNYIAGLFWGSSHLLVVFIDSVIGPALFVIRAVRLKEVRQFWRRLICNGRSLLT